MSKMNIGSGHTIYELIFGNTNKGLFDIGLREDQLDKLFIYLFSKIPKRDLASRNQYSENILRRVQGNNISRLRSGLYIAGRDLERGKLVIPETIPLIFSDISYKLGTLEYALSNSSLNEGDIGKAIIKGATIYYEESKKGPDKRFLEYRRIVSQL